MRCVLTLAIVTVLVAADSCAQELQFPRDAAGYVRRGDARRDAGHVDAAIQDYDEAIKLSPELATPWKHRGRALFSKGDLEGAIRDLTESIRLCPEDFSALSPEAVKIYKDGAAT